MPINTDLSVSPYFDDFNEDKNYYKVLFKPGVAVQVRELNQLQALLQNQIEKFGNNIYKRGTIIDGVNFIYHPEYSYVKLLDSQLDGVPADPASYVTNFAVEPTTNLTAHIINSQEGFESQDPNLKTIYLRYINSGISGEETAFAPGAVLKVYDYLDSISSIRIDNGSSGFSNTDAIVICSALAVNSLTNTAFTPGETITQTGNTHFAIVIGIETVNGKKILKIRPRTADLTNTAVSSTTWEFTPGQDIIGSTSGATATVLHAVGNTAVASLTTSADIGKITQINVVSRGQGYFVAPYVTVKSSGVASAIGPRNYNDLSLIGRNFIAQVTVANTVTSVGSGYAFSVSEGVIYQKGYFVRVNPQTVIVEKYHNKPDQLVIGFDTVETVIDSNADQELLDNSTGTSNEYAPGADRLNLEPTLVVLSAESASANDEFLSIVEFSEGYPYRESKRTQFNTLMDEMALRTTEQSGDFVLDKFLVTTRSSANQANEGKYFAAITDPGRGYINGYRVETRSNYAVNVEKGIDTRSASNLSATIDYGNYILINQVAGLFNCNNGDLLNLTDTTHTYLDSSFNTGTVTQTGATIGTARVRNVVYDSGELGTGNATYRLYLFDIKMSAGKTFDSIRSVFSDQSTDGTASAVLTFDATKNANVCKLFDNGTGSSLLVSTGSNSTKNISNLNYIYRTTSETVDIANNGTTSVLLSAPTEYFGYDSSSLTDLEKRTLSLVPTSAEIVLQANTTTDGTANAVTASNTITMSTVSIINNYNIGDYIALYTGASTYVVRKITGKTGTTLSLDSNASFTNGTASFARAFPRYVPVPIDRIPGATVTVTGGGKTLNLFLGRTLLGTTAKTCSLTYDVEVRGASAQGKTAERDNFIKIDLSTANTTGPWCVGIPDIIRLKNVYLSNANTVSTSSTDVTDQFFIDHNQSADYYGLGYLYKRNDANITLNSGTFLLVRFDALTSSPGVYTINSYVSSNTEQRFTDDSMSLNDLGTKINSFEVPEVYTADGRYFDLLNYIDFRPAAANTVAYAKTAGAANTNPSEVVTFSGANKKFPLPESGVSFNRDYFLGRKDVVVISNDNRIKVVRGVPSEGSTYADPKIPQNVLVLNKLVIPSYPCVPEKFSANTMVILDKKLSNERLLLKRIRDKTVKAEATENDINVGQPKAFSMADINRLERRLQDLEYTVSLSLVESDLKEKVIPSAVSPEINRFKFGFFVDDYTTKKNSDIDNAEYNADVIDSRVVPITQSTLTTHGKGFRLNEWESEFAIINQDLASQVVTVTAPPPSTQPPSVTPPSSPPSTPPAPNPPGPPVVVPPTPVPPSPPPSPPTPVVVAKEVCVYRVHTQSTTKNRDLFRVTMSSVPSTFKITTDFWSQADYLYVHQVGYDGNQTILLSEVVKGVKTFTLNHDPALGRDYIIQTVRKSDYWAYTLCYPIDDISYTTPVAPEPNVNALFYTGLLASITPGYTSPQELFTNFGTLAYVTQGDTQRVLITGLKPNTVHTIKLNDPSTSVTVNPVVTNPNEMLGSSSSIMSSAYGILLFDMVIDNSIVSSLNSLASQSPGYNGVPAAIQVLISSSDNMSVSGFYIQTKQATVAPSPAPTPVFVPPVYGGPVADATPYNGGGRGLYNNMEAF